MTKPVRVVIAEDEAIIRLDLKEILEEEGYEVVGETGRGDHAIELVRELKPDLAILDIKMPGMDGLTAARTIAGERLAAVLILTAFSQHDLVEQARDAGALAYLVKPFQKSDLMPAIEMALGRFEQIVALEHENADLAERLEARKIIDRAKGRLMDEHGMSEGRLVAVPAEGGDGLPPQDPRGRGRRRRRHPQTGVTGPHRPRATQSAAVEGPSVAPSSYHRRRCRSCCCSTAIRSRTGRSSRCRPTSRRRPAPSRTRSTASRRCSPRCSPTSSPIYLAVAFDAPGGSTYRYELDPEYKAGRKETPDLFRCAAAADPRGARRARDHAARDSRRRGRRRDRDARDRGRGRGHRRRDRHRRPRLVPARAAIRTSRCSTTSAASPTTRSTTRRVSPNAAAASRPRSISTTRACAATRATTCPACPGIGEKTAAKLITTYGGLEGIYEHLDELPPKQRTNLGRRQGPRVQEPRDVAPDRATSTSRARVQRPATGRVRP